MMVAPSALYYVAQSYMIYMTPESVKLYEAIAYSYFAVLFAGIVLVFYGGVVFLRLEKNRVRDLEIIPIKVRLLIAYVLSLRRFGRLFLLGSLVYGLFYSFLSG